jgi:hypothetical protein
MSDHILGRGVLSWDSAERQVDRYGTVRLFRHHRPHAPSVAIATGHEGCSGMLLVRVIEARRSHHVGDLHRKIYPVTPEVGEVIVLGVGELARQAREPLYVVGLIPADDRERDWLDPVRLFRAHDQTVELIFRPDGRVRIAPRVINPIVLGHITSMHIVGVDHGKRWPAGEN